MGFTTNDSYTKAPRAGQEDMLRDVGHLMSKEWNVPATVIAEALYHEHSMFQVGCWLKMLDLYFSHGHRDKFIALKLT